MKYIIDNNSLIIYNVEGNLIFAINKLEYWVKYDYDHNGNEISYENQWI